jgi:LPXTG-site transpeptidase (sortase) family protein
LAAIVFSSAPLGVSADSGVCAIPGRDGPGGSLGGVVNTYYPGAATAPAGATSISVGSPSGSSSLIAAGDLLLVIQMQDAFIDSTNSDAYGDGSAGDPATGWTNPNNVGLYEYVVATGPVSGGSVPIRGDGGGNGLVYTYTSAAANATDGQRTFQVVRVPQYSTATLSSALTVLPWNGSVGGVLAIDVAGELTLGGTVSVDAMGFRGGGGRQLGGSGGFQDPEYVTLSTGIPNGAKGEGIAGTPILVYDGTSVVNTGVEGYPNGAMARGAPGNAGGGGTDGQLNNDQNSGGGGGGNGGAGGLGGFTWNTILDRGGHGGAAFTVAAADRLVMGAGGGAGTRNNTPGVAAASSGGVGGGIVMMRAGTLTGTGSITANGGVGVVPLNDGSGGGGAGGSILLTAQTWSPASLTVSAVGGAGANNWVTQAPGTPGEFTPGSGNARHGPGGGGGGGVVLLSSGTNVTADASGGAAGTTTTAASNFGAQPGAAGVVSSTVTPGDIPTGISGILCLPELTVTKTTSTPLVVNGPSGTSATYTITVTNNPTRGTAINLSISDNLPSDFTFASTTSVSLSGGATRPSTADPTAGDTDPTWGTFEIPGGGQIEITFVVNIAPSVLDGTYDNPALTTYADPQRTTSGGTTSASYDSASSSGEDVTVVSQNPALDVTKSETSAGPYGVGDTITYDIVVENTGNVTLTGVTVSDPVATVGACAPVQPSTLAPGATMTCAASYVVTQADIDAGSFTNTATADSGETGPDTDSETVTFTQTAALDVTKSETSAGPYGVGDTITYDIVVENTGDVTLTGVTASDPVATVGACTPAQPSSLTPGATMTCAASYVVTQADVDAGSFTNTATADSAETGPDTDDETVTFTQMAALEIVKEVGTSPAGPWIDTSITVDVGDDVYYRITVENTGNVTLTGILVSDPDVDTSGCTWTDPLGVGLSTSCVVGPVVAVAGTNTNTATADSVEAGPESDGAEYQTTGVNVTDPAVVKTGDPATAAVGDTVVFTLVITNEGTVTATNVRVVDPVPSFLTVTNVVSVPAATADNSVGNTVDLLYATVAPTDTFTVTIATIVNSSATPPGGPNVVTLTADADDDPTNNTDTATITIVIGGAGAPETGFAPGGVTHLPPQPADLTYAAYGDLWLEIPSLDMETEIVGIPASGIGWDVSWLGTAAGYLNGTAFPTWQGNSVITAHVTLPNGTPGPFADLKSLRFGDRVVIHAWGLRHTYEIRDVDVVTPSDPKIFRHEERPWLTLVTCHGYSELEAAYLWRVAARAVLVSIEVEGTQPGSVIVFKEAPATPTRPPGITSGR